MTVTVACPLFPAPAAVICAVPADTPVTTPLASTVAMVAAVLLQATVPVANTAPFWSTPAAVAVVVRPD